VNVVSDASALINLARIRELDLLPRLYGDILIPAAVWQEVVMDGAGRPGSEEIERAPWIVVKQVENRDLVHALRQDLDAGEAEAIALSVELEADLLVMDERWGREAAARFGLRYIGLIGILIAVKRRGWIEAVKPHLDALRDVAGFRVRDALYHRVLRDEGEAA
jgi:uncharacterized protein